MIRHLATMLLALATVLVAGCEPYRQESDWPDPSPAIWEVTSESGQTGWLFGTVHALPRDLAWGTPLLDETFANAGVLVVEVADLDPDYGQALIERLSQASGQPPLTQRVEAGEREELRALLDDAGMDDDDFAEVDTWAAALTLAGAVRKGDPALGVDRALIANAENVVGLETFGEQLALFDRLSPAAQADLLYGVARTHASDTDNPMLLAWLTGDTDQLGRYVNEGLEISPELERVLLLERNRRWTDSIAEVIDAGRRPFVAVGAGHMVGENGLAAMLAQRGYTVRRIQ